MLRVRLRRVLSRPSSWLRIRRSLSARRLARVRRGYGVLCKSPWRSPMLRTRCIIGLTPRIKTRMGLRLSLPLAGAPWIGRLVRPRLMVRRMGIIRCWCSPLIFGVRRPVLGRRRSPRMGLRRCWKRIGWIRGVTRLVLSATMILRLGIILRMVRQLTAPQVCVLVSPCRFLRLRRKRMIPLMRA